VPASSRRIENEGLLGRPSRRLPPDPLKTTELFARGKCGGGLAGEAMGERRKWKASGPAFPPGRWTDACGDRWEQAHVQGKPRVLTVTSPWASGSERYPPTGPGPISRGWDGGFKSPMGGGVVSVGLGA
jgi:hypothetical protein